MDVTNRFVLDVARRHGGRVLDYGCGSGQVVFAGREAGLEIYGTDVFYEGSETRRPDVPFIREMKDGSIPFPDGFFDLVTNNQVMEHVRDLDAVLGEIHRVVRPGGTVLSIFPSRDVWREGHIGIPFAHWFQPGSRFRFFYTWGLRAVGFGYWKQQAPTSRQWAIDKLIWIDRWTVYRGRAEILRSYGRMFANEFREADYIFYRLRDQPGILRKLAISFIRLPVISSLAVWLFRKMAFMVILSKPLK